MIKLVAMDEKDYQAYLQVSVGEYARHHVEAGNWDPSEAQARAEREFQQLLPEGLLTENSYFYTICDEGSAARVGMIWVAVFPNRAIPNAFIYDIRIDEQHQRKGYATQALAALEDKMAALGVKSIGLHVFGHNQAARALYEKVGYQVTNLTMAKNL